MAIDGHMAAEKTRFVDFFPPYFLGLRNSKSGSSARCPRSNVEREVSGQVLVCKVGDVAVRNGRFDSAVERTCLVSHRLVGRALGRPGRGPGLARPGGGAAAAGEARQHRGRGPLLTL